MKNLQYIRRAQYEKGFVVPLLIGIIALLVIGGGIYIYENKKAEVPSVTNTEIQQPDQVQQTGIQNTPVTTNENPTPVKSPKLPVISSILPNSATTNLLGSSNTYTITGSGFTHQWSPDYAGMGWNYRTDDLVIFQNAQGQKINVFSIGRGLSPNDNKITFTLPTQGCDYSKMEKSCYELPINPGIYSVSVWTPNGISNAVNFTVSSGGNSNMSGGLWPTYTNTKYGYSYQYPSFASIGYVNGSVDNPNIDFGSVVPNIRASVNSTAGDVTVANCYDSSSANIIKEIINGITFYPSVISDQEAGIAHQSDVYATVHNNMCYQISLNMGWSTSAGTTYTFPGERKTVEAYFRKVLDSFKFTSNQ